MSVSQSIMIFGALFVFIGFFAVIRWHRNFLRCLMGMQIGFAGCCAAISVNAAQRTDADGVLCGIFVLCAGMLYVAVGLTVFSVYLKKRGFSADKGAESS